MTTRAGDRGRVEGQISNRVRVSSRVPVREEWAAKRTPPPVGTGPV
jgi:hypothetical protein